MRGGRCGGLGVEGGRYFFSTVREGDQIMFATDDEAERSLWVQAVYRATGQSHKPVPPSNQPQRTSSTQLSKVQGGLHCCCLCSSLLSLLTAVNCAFCTRWRRAWRQFSSVMAAGLSVRLAERDSLRGSPSVSWERNKMPLVFIGPRLDLFENDHSRLSESSAWSVISGSLHTRLLDFVIWRKINYKS